MEGFKFKVEDFSPVPTINQGTYTWPRVIASNSKYLRYTDDKEKAVTEYEPLNPVKMWLEDRWTFFDVCTEMLSHRSSL